MAKTAGLLLYYSHLVRMRGLTNAEFGRVIRFVLQEHAPAEVTDRMRECDFISADELTRIEALMVDQLDLEAADNEKQYALVCEKRKKAGQARQRKPEQVAEATDAKNDGGERGIRTLASLQRIYSLSRGAPSAKLGYFSS